MTFEARERLRRIEYRLAAMAGEYLAEHEQEPMDLWFMPLLRSWSQLRTLRQTGQVLQFYGLKNHPQSSADMRRRA